MRLPYPSGGARDPLARRRDVVAGTEHVLRVVGALELLQAREVCRRVGVARAGRVLEEVQERAAGDVGRQRADVLAVDGRAERDVAVAGGSVAAGDGSAPALDLDGPGRGEDRVDR